MLLIRLCINEFLMNWGEGGLGGDGAKGRPRDWRMAEVQNGWEKEMRQSGELIGQRPRPPSSICASSSEQLFFFITVTSSVTPVRFLSSSVCFNPFFMYLSKKNTTPFADLVSFPRCSSVENRLFFQMVSGILFALWLLSLIIVFHHLFSSCSCQISLCRLCIFFFDSSCFFLWLQLLSVFAGSHHAVLPPDGWLLCHRRALQPAPLSTKNGWPLFRRWRDWIRLSHTLQSMMGKH